MYAKIIHTNQNNTYLYRYKYSLLTAALEAKFGVPAANASILRTEFLTADKQKFE